MQLLRGVRKQRAFTVSCNTVYPPPSIRVALIFYDIKHHNTINLLQKVVIIGLDGRTGTEVAGGPNERYGKYCTTASSSYLLADYDIKRKCPLVKDGTRGVDFQLVDQLLKSEPEYLHVVTSYFEKSN